MANKVDQLAKILPNSWDAGSQVHYSKLTDAVNSLLGYNGPAVVGNDLDVQGNNVQNVADPSAPTDAVNLQTADSKYSPAVTGPQFDVGGSNALKGVTYLYRQQQAALSVTIVTAKLTALGANGSMTFKNGLLVAQVPAT